jgi:phosphoribosylanthranilate isomerase
MVQLHGNEPIALCTQLKQQGIPVIKAFSISSPADFLDTKEYVDVCDYFLFDTKTPQYGGSGLKFDWQILQAYTYHVPFFLSGGIALSDVEEIKKIAHPQLVAIDVNSRFETSPATKNINQLQQFIQEIKQLNTY